MLLRNSESNVIVHDNLSAITLILVHIWLNHYFVLFLLKQGYQTYSLLNTNDRARCDCPNSNKIWALKIVPYFFPEGFYIEL